MLLHSNYDRTDLIPNSSLLHTIVILIYRLEINTIIDHESYILFYLLDILAYLESSF